MDSSSPTGGGTATQVTFVGLWGGYCTAWGTDPDHPDGVKYTSGTFKMTVEGQNWQGYCIDLHHSISSGDTYQANVHAGAEAGLCEAHWIVANYNYNNPGSGLSSAEEGAAIQAALWHYVGGFDPVWNSNHWCKKQAVYQRAMAIISAAQGQCVPIPANIDLTALPTTLKSGETSNLLATVTDQRGNGYAGQTVNFSGTPGSVLGSPSGVTDGAGQVANTFTYDGQGTQTATASIAGQVGSGAVDPINVAKQRVMIVKSISYSGEDPADVTWESTPTAVFLNYFQVEGQGTTGGAIIGGSGTGRSLLLKWETATELDNMGFNIYRGPGASGPWTKLNPQLIPSQVPPGSTVGATYEFTDPSPNRANRFYLLEDISTSGVVTQHGPISY
jgi:hypothetical protein